MICKPVYAQVHSSKDHISLSTPGLHLGTGGEPPLFHGGQDRAPAHQDTTPVSTANDLAIRYDMIGILIMHVTSCITKYILYKYIYTYDLVMTNKAYVRVQ